MNSRNQKLIRSQIKAHFRTDRRFINYPRECAGEEKEGGSSDCNERKTNTESNSQKVISKRNRPIYILRQFGRVSRVIPLLRALLPAWLSPFLNVFFTPFHCGALRCIVAVELSYILGTRVKLHIFRPVLVYAYSYSIPFVVIAQPCNNSTLASM